MTPGTLVLLHEPLSGATAWNDLPQRLTSYGLTVIAPDLPGVAGMQYVARAALALRALDPQPPLLLVAHGASGPLLPAVALAQRAAHRPVAGYLFVDADLPAAQNPADHAHDHDRPNPADHVPPVPADWPDAPCAYLKITEAHAQDARIAGLRAWPTATSAPDEIAETLYDLIRTP